MAEENDMISPFEKNQVRENENGRIIFRNSSYGYDVSVQISLRYLQIFTSYRSKI